MGEIGHTGSFVIENKFFIFFAKSADFGYFPKNAHFLNMADKHFRQRI